MRISQTETLPNLKGCLGSAVNTADVWGVFSVGKQTGAVAAGQYAGYLKNFDAGSYNATYQDDAHVYPNSRKCKFLICWKK